MKTNIVIVIPCWGRAAVFAAVCKTLDYFYQQTKDKINLTVLIQSNRLIGPEKQIYTCLN